MFNFKRLGPQIFRCFDELGVMLEEDLVGTRDGGLPE